MSSDTPKPSTPQSPRSSLIPSLGGVELKSAPLTRDHSAPDPNHERSSPTWVELCAEDDVSVDGIYPYDLPRESGLHPIILVRTYGGLYALHDECPHRRVALSDEGYLDGQTLHCGWHHWGFSVETGAHTIPTGICIERFEVKVDAGQVWVGY